MNEKREILTRLVASVLPTEYVPGVPETYIEILNDCNEIAEEIMKHSEDKSCKDEGGVCQCDWICKKLNPDTSC